MSEFMINSGQRDTNSGLVSGLIPTSQNWAIRRRIDSLRSIIGSLSAILNTCSTPSGGESRGLEFEPKLTKKSKKGLVLGLVCDILFLLSTSRA